MSSSSNIKSDYMRQRERIRRLIKSAEKRGYHFNENPAQEPIPSKPTQADVDHLASYTPERLYSQATAEQIIYDRNGQATIKTVSGTERRKQERSEAGRRGYQAHREAEEEGYSSVQSYRSSQTVQQAEETDTQSDTSNASRYAEVAAKQSMPVETIKSMGFNNIEEMLDDPVGSKFVNYWYETVYPTMDVSGKKEVNTTPVQGYTESDLDAAFNRTESDANSFINAGRIQESILTFDSLERRINQFAGVGADNLRRVLNLQVHYYGRNTVADALKRLEESDPGLMEQLDELMNYSDNGYSPIDASRAYRALSDAITSFGEGNFSSKDLGNVLDAMEVFEDA